MRYSIWMTLFIAGLLLAGCGKEKSGETNTNHMDHTEDMEETNAGDDVNRHMHRRDFDDLVAAFESPERDVWQRPDEVVALLGDLDGKTVVDIGSGTGYFSFRMAEKGARVICADIDERFLDYIEKERKKKGYSRKQVKTRKVAEDSPGMEPGEADIVLIVNTYHHISNRSDYFFEVWKGLKRGGKLVVVDFYKKELPVGPPLEMKLTSKEVTRELIYANFAKVTANTALLPYQYIVMAYKD